MKKLLFVFVLLATNSYAQSVCQLRYNSGVVWASPPDASDTYGHTTYATDAHFIFDYPGEEGAAEIVNTTGWVPSVWIGGVKHVWATDGVTSNWTPWKDEGITFEAFYQRNGGSLRGPYGVGNSTFKMTGARDEWKPAVVNSRYMGLSVYTFMSTTVRVCGNESQLLQPFGETIGGDIYGGPDANIHWGLVNPARLR